MPLLFLLLLFISCSNPSQQTPGSFAHRDIPPGNNPYPFVGSIPLPPGFTRIPARDKDYISWLRKLGLKKDRTVYTYNGRLKNNQSAQFAVLDVSVGDKDLQQCADAVMRLWAEYLYSQQRFGEIDFTDNNHTHYQLPANASRHAFDQYLEKVFSFCGTASLANQLSPVNAFATIKGGDVLVKGGSPGHAMQVMDIAVNKAGEKIYLLAQGYMPAQDIHIVVNPGDNQLSPWYKVRTGAAIETPEWTFHPNNLKSWPGE